MASRSAEIPTSPGASRRAAAPSRGGWSAERRFYFGMTLAILAAVLLGFARTFFLRRWFPEWAQAHGAPEPYFYFHGALFTLWFALLLVQPSLVAAGRLDLHRRLGRLGAGLAAVMVVVGTIGALIAARRPTGFVDVPVPPLQFLTIPLTIIVLFGIFVALAVLTRGKPQSHKRFMLLASICLIDAAIVRWPFAVMATELPIPFTMDDVFVDLFLLPMVAWDLASRGRIHPVTLWGGLTLIASQPLRLVLGGTAAWLGFAGWAVGLLGG